LCQERDILAKAAAWFARETAVQSQSYSRNEWDVRVEATLQLRLTRTAFLVEGGITALDHGKEVFLGALRRRPSDRSARARRCWRVTGCRQILTGGHIFLHVLGSDPGTNTEVFGPGSVAGQEVEAAYFFRAD
jgi:hypothetical protein